MHTIVNLALLNHGMNLPHAKSQSRKEKEFLNTPFFHFILQFSNAVNLYHTKS
jgi:hypothetical protein